MNNKNPLDMDYILEIDRMINEGLGGGMIEYDYQQQQLELPDRKRLKKNMDDKDEP